MGRILYWWDNRPETLHKTPVDNFLMAHALFDCHPTMVAELLIVASRTKMIVGSIPDRPIENNSYFWKEVLDQVNDVLLRAGTQYTSSLEIAAALRVVPNFEMNEFAKQHLAMIRSKAHIRLWENKASRRVVLESYPVSVSSPDQSVSPTRVRSRPDRRYPREDDGVHDHHHDTDTDGLRRVPLIGSLPRRNPVPLGDPLPVPWRVTIVGLRIVFLSTKGLRIGCSTFLNENV